jgi:NAD(P)H dehydrogenase (quinone)
VTARVLVLYYSRKGTTAELARHSARGVESAGAEALVRTVPPVSPSTEIATPPVPDSGPPYAELADLEACDGLVMGSPTRFGNMAAPLKHFLDSTGSLWLAGTLVDKPAGVFTSASSLHGGMESTLITMALPLIHHGMLWVGVPYTHPAIHATRSGGGPYGASHIASEWNTTVTKDEQAIARALGERVAQIAIRLRAAAGTQPA